MYTLYYSIATRSLRQVHGARHVRACSARCLWRVSGRPTAHLDLWARPSAVLRVTGRSDSTASESGRSPLGGFGAPERKTPVPVSGRSCGAASDPSATPASPNSTPGSGRSTCGLIMRRPQAANPDGLYRVPLARAWWPAVGAPP